MTDLCDSHRFTPANYPRCPLTDTTIRQARPADKARKLLGGSGLFLQISPHGGKWWRLKYRFDGKAKLISLGTYPDVSLKQARERRDAARKQIADGIDPSAERKAQKAKLLLSTTGTFEAVAREWLEKSRAKFVDAPELLALSRRIETIGQINRYAIATGRAVRDPNSRSALWAAVKKANSHNPSSSARGRPRGVLPTSSSSL